MDEKVLVQRLQAGDQRAFGDLLDLYETRIYRLTLRYANSQQDAEDITQEIFVSVYRGIAGFRGASSFSTWLYRVALNHCLEYRRKQKPESVPYEEGVEVATSDWRDDPVQVTTRREVSREVEEAISKLSPIHREVILLHELQGLTYQECADVLGAPVGTIKSRLSNAFVRLRELLGDAVLEQAGT